MLVRGRGSWAGFLQDGSTADPPSLPFWGQCCFPASTLGAQDQAPDSFQ